MSEDKGITTLMILLTALGALAIIILFGWVFFFNPTNSRILENETPQRALADGPLPEERGVELPQKSPEEELLDGLQQGEEVPGLLEDDQPKDVVIRIDEPQETISPDDFPKEEEVVAEEIEPLTAPVKIVPDPIEEKQPVYREVEKTIYWLQVGSFPNSQVAEKLRTSLKNSGVDSIIKTITVNDTLYYRVRVGAFQSEAEAKSFKTKLLNLEDIEEVVLYTDYKTETIRVD